MKTTKVYVESSDWDCEKEEYEGVRIPEPSVTVMVCNPNFFAEVFEDDKIRQMIVQNLRDEVIKYNNGKSFPKHALAAFKAEGDAIFDFNRLERDEYGEHLFAYYEFVSTVS